MNQLSLPTAGETVAVMHTNMGDISIRLFPDHAPKAVENFTTPKTVITMASYFIGSSRIL